MQRYHRENGRKMGMIDRLRSLLPHRSPAPRYGSSSATEQDVVNCYRMLLDREPDEAGLHNWRTFIKNAQIPVSAIVDALITSAEFKAAQSARHEPALVACSEFEMFVAPNDALIGREIFLTKQYEPHVTRMLRSLLRSGDTFVDIGANLGYFTLLAARLVGDRGAVIAFEPNPENCRLLRRSLAQNGIRNVHLHEKAVAESAQRLSFSTSSLHSNARILRPEELHGHEEWYDQVEAIALDDILGDLVAEIALIKIDIEGAEPRAWQGMQALLQRHRPIILTEYSPDLIRATSACEPRSYLEQLWQAHHIAIIKRSGKTQEVTSVDDIVRAQAAAAATGVHHLDLVAYPR